MADQSMPTEFVLWGGCVMRHPLLDRAEAVEAGGFSSMSVQTGDISRFLAGGGSLTDARRELESRGAPICCVDPFLGWYPGYDPATARGEAAAELRATEDEVLRWAEELGATSITALGPFHGASASFDEAADSLGAFVDRAGAAGLRIQLEPIPTTKVPDLASGLALLEAVSRPNLGLVLDTYNLFRGGLTPDQLDGVSHEQIFAIQLADAETAEPKGTDYFEDAYHHRALPGEGVLPMEDVIRRLTAKGPLAPLGPEVFSDALLSLPPAPAGRRCADSTRQFLRAAFAS
jgi:sugar phosphate isomerase/epimerase